MPHAPRPLVLVNADQRSLDGYTWHAAIDTYIDALVNVAGVNPLVVPALGAHWAKDQLSHLVEMADGVLMTGSRSNVHPSCYGEEATAHHEPFDPARDATTLPLIRLALEQGVPLFAICRGHQELNVAFGGTLETEIQTQDGRLDHRGGPTDAPKEERFALNHTVDITEGGLLRSVLGVPSIKVNSVHRQAIGKLGQGLMVEAKAADGTIEAIGVKEAKSFALGLQWHPEHWASLHPQADDPSTALFKAFGDAARQHQQKRA